MKKLTLTLVLGIASCTSMYGMQRITKKVEDEYNMCMHKCMLKKGTPKEGLCKKACADTYNKDLAILIAARQARRDSKNSD